MSKKGGWVFEATSSLTPCKRKKGGQAIVGRLLTFFLLIFLAFSRYRLNVNLLSYTHSFAIHKKGNDSHGTPCTTWESRFSFAEKKIDLHMSFYTNLF